MMARIFNRISYFLEAALSRKIVDYEGVKLLVQHELLSEPVKRSIYRRMYERAEISILKRTLEKNDRVLELGSCMGFLGIYVSKQVGSENAVLVEANPDMIPLLEANLANNGVSPKVINAMVGASDEADADFYVMPDVWSSSAINKDAQKSRAIRIESISLATLLGRTRPTYLIVDIEGAEKDILDACVLKNSTVQKICAELHPKYIGNQATSRLIRDIEDAGFQTDWEQCRDSTYYFSRTADA